MNSNSVLAEWNVYAYGKSQAKITINGAGGAYGSTIRSYSIVTDPSVGSASVSSLTTGILYKKGDITVTAKVTDSRGRTTSKTASFSVSAYGAPFFHYIEAYRCLSDGTQDDVNGTYAYIKTKVGCSAINSGNRATATVQLSQVGGGYSTSVALTDDTGIILGNGQLAIDASYSFILKATDTVGTVTTYVGEINSASYIMHVKKGGKALGFGTAAGADETVSFAWP